METETKTDRKSGSIDTADKLREYELSFAKELHDYALSLQEKYKESPDEAREAAKEALRRTGVILHE